MIRSKFMRVVCTAIALLLPGVAICGTGEPAKVILEGGPNGFAGGPLRFTLGCEEAVLSAKKANGDPLGYAQRDGDVYVLIAPAIAAGEKLEILLSPATLPRNRVRLDKHQHHIEVYVDGRHFTSYHHSPDLIKPYFYPVIVGEGLRPTRGWPMVENDDTEVHDHPHHTSWWVAYGEVNDSNFWHNGEDKQSTIEIGEIVSGPVFGKFLAKNEWVAGDGHRVCLEEREFYFYASEGADRVTDMRVTFTASDGNVVFHDTKEGGICSFRLNPTIDEANGNGEMTNSEGGVGAAECWGKPAKWMDYCGEIRGQKVGIAVLDHPSNLRHPTRWHIRDYGLYTANCFGLSYFLEDEKADGSYTIPDGETLTFRYRVLMHLSGSDNELREAQFRAYAEPPVVVVQ